MDKEKQQQQFPLVKKTVSQDNSGKKQCRNYNKYLIWNKKKTHEEKNTAKLKIKSAIKERAKKNKKRIWIKKGGQMVGIEGEKRGMLSLKPR